MGPPVKNATMNQRTILVKIIQPIGEFPRKDATQFTKRESKKIPRPIRIMKQSAISIFFICLYQDIYSHHNDQVL